MGVLLVCQTSTLDNASGKLISEHTDYLFIDLDSVSVSNEDLQRLANDRSGIQIVFLSAQNKGSIKLESRADDSEFLQKPLSSYEIGSLVN